MEVMMILKFLGTGSAFVSIKKNYQSNIILKAANGETLLIDCGSDIRHSLEDVGLNYHDIDNVYISHLHADHAGGLEWLGFNFLFNHGAKKPKLIAHPEVLKLLWEHVLKGGMQCLEGKNPCVITDFFKLEELNTVNSFQWQSINFELVPTIHVYNGTDLLPSYGLFFDTKKTKVFITTDTSFQPEPFMPYYESADLIFHDCETTKNIGKVHAHFTQLATLPNSIKAKMWLYHYDNPNVFDALGNGFLGYVKKGQKFNI
jgi:ribonuclease BN (tRNA processing enzyme)